MCAYVGVCVCMFMCVCMCVRGHANVIFFQINCLSFYIRKIKSSPKSLFVCVCACMTDEMYVTDNINLSMVLAMTSDPVTFDL